MLRQTEIFFVEKKTAFRGLLVVKKLLEGAIRSKRLQACKSGGLPFVVGLNIQSSVACYASQA